MYPVPFLEVQVDLYTTFSVAVILGGLLAGFVAAWFKANKAEIKVAEIHKLTNSSMSKMFLVVGLQGAIIGLFVLYTFMQLNKKGNKL